MSTGRKCDFLLSSSKRSWEFRLGSSKLQRGPASETLELSPTTNIRFLSVFTANSYEVLCIQSYQNFIAKEFSATFEIALWQRVIIQAANIEHYVRTAVIAIGALVRNRKAGYAVHRQLYEYEYSLKQYNLAIQELNRRLDNSAHSWELAILGAFLFTAFEVIQGRDDRANMHIRSAFAILKSFPKNIMQNKSLNGPTPEKPFQALDIGYSNISSASDVLALFNAFSRLDPQASSFRALNSLASSQLPNLPSKLTDLIQAREFLLSITNAMHFIFSSATSENKTLPYTPLPVTLARDISMVQGALDWWFRHFSNLTSHLRIKDVKTTAIVQVLLIHHRVAQIQASTYFFRDQSVFDLYFSEFEHIVSLGRAAAEADRILASSMKAGPCFIFDIGMVQPIFFVARKCRDGRIRRMAIEVMEKTRRRKVRDVQLLARVARWIITVEEEGLDLCNGAVAEEKRLHDMELDFYIPEGSCRVTTWRRRVDGSPEEVSVMLSIKSGSEQVDMLIPS